jgi:5-methylcytosine-specific restriction endonuclease McrA
MDTYDRTHLDDDRLERSFDTHASQERGAIAALLADMAEIDARHLFLRSGFESMRAYCMQKLHLTEGAAAKRIFVARLARELPALFPAIADGRLHLTGVRTLGPRLNAGNVDEWVAAAAYKTVEQVERLLACRYPQAEPLRLDDGFAPQVLAAQQDHQIQPQVVVPQQLGKNSQVLRPASPVAAATTPVELPPKTRTKIAPLSPDRYAFNGSFPGETFDLLVEVRALLSHAIPSGDYMKVIHYSLLTTRGVLKGRKFGANSSNRQPRSAASQRCIPARTRRAVYERDEGRCAFVHGDGQRCDSRNRLEFDHIQPVARGGTSTLENLRLVCRAHNQYEAERAFGREFIERRKASRRSSAGR